MNLINKKNIPLFDIGEYCRQITRFLGMAKTSEESSGAVLVPQPHGGAIIQGTNYGNKGGGRPPSAIRRTMRRSLDDRIPLLHAIADDPDVRPRDRIEALKLLAQYGLGESDAWPKDSVVSLVQELADLMAGRLAPEDHEALSREIYRAIERHKP